MTPSEPGTWPKVVPLRRKNKQAPAWFPCAIAAACLAVVAVIGSYTTLHQPASGEITVNPSSRPSTPPPLPSELPSKPVLTLRWPEATREGATVLIDGESMLFPASGPVTFPLKPRPKPYEMVLNRPDYEPIEFERTSKAGEKIEPLVVNWKKASSTEFMGEFWLRKLAKCVIQGDFNGFVGTETIGFSHRQFCFVVQALNRACRNRPFGTEPVEN